MSYRLQLKFLMQKTSKEANWDMDKDSEVRSHSDSEEDQEILKGYYKHQTMWKAIEKLNEAPLVEPKIVGVGGSLKAESDDALPYMV